MISSSADRAEPSNSMHAGWLGGLSTLGAVAAAIWRSLGEPHPNFPPRFQTNQKRFSKQSSRTNSYINIYIYISRNKYVNDWQNKWNLWTCGCTGGQTLRGSRWRDQHRSNWAICAGKPIRNRGASGADASVAGASATCAVCCRFGCGSAWPRQLWRRDTCQINFRSRINSGPIRWLMDWFTFPLTRCRCGGTVAVSPSRF